MNKQHAAAWDDLVVLAEENAATIHRDGHRFAYVWADGHVQVWAEADMPCFNLRVGGVSARCWNIEGLRIVLDALLMSEHARSTSS